MPKNFKIILCILATFVAAYLASACYLRNSIKNEDFVQTEGTSSNYSLDTSAKILLPQDILPLNTLEILLTPIKSRGQPIDIAVAGCGNTIAKKITNQPETISVPLSCSLKTISISAAGGSELPQLNVDWKLSSHIFGLPVPSILPVIISFLVGIIIVYSLSFRFPVLISLIPVAFLDALFAASDVSRQNSLLCLAGLLSFSLALLCSAPIQNITQQLSKRKLRPVLLCIFFVAALAIRLYGINFGLPDQYHPDERWKVQAIRGMERRGSLNPEYFFHPSQLLYLTMATHSVGKQLGVLDDSDADIILAGRFISAVAGAATVPVAMLIGSAVSAEPIVVGVIATLLPMHVTASRYLKEDALLSFWVCVAFLLMLRAARSTTQSLKPLSLAGLSAGLACSAKYSGVLVCLFFGIYLWEKRKEGYQKLFFAAVTFVLFVLVAFFLTCPYSVLDMQKFVAGLQYEHNHMGSGHTVPVSPWRQLWLYHFWRSILPSFGVGLIAVALLNIFKVKKKQLAYPLLAFLLFYLAAEYVPAKIEPQPERYVMPAAIFLSILCGVVTKTFSDKRIRYLTALLVICSVAFPAVKALRLSEDLLDDTRAKMARWISANVEGETVYVDYAAYTKSTVANTNVRYDTLPRIGYAYGLGEAFLPSHLEKMNVTYFVLSSFTLNDFLYNPEAPRVFKIRIKTLFRKAQLLHVEQPNYISFGFHNPTLYLFKIPQA